MEKNIIKVLSIDSGIYNLTTYQSLFEQMSNLLMNNYILYVNKSKYQISEIEFYLKDENHNDPFIHGDKDQSVLGRWYFHKQFGKNYKSGTYKGVDITFGYKDKSRTGWFGGILIRSIINLNDNTIIEGPCKVVNKLLEENDVDNISSLVEKCKKVNMDKNHETITVSKVNNKSLIFLKYDVNKELTKSQIFSGPRVGLTLKRYTKSREGFLMNNYRFINKINRIKKFRSGMILSMWKNGMTKEEINVKTGTSLSNIQKYINYFYNAKKDNIKAISYNRKKLNVKDLCILQSICKKIKPKF